MIRDFNITAVSDQEIDMLHFLVDEFVLSHGSLQFRDNYWPGAQDWFQRINHEENSKLLAARSHGRIIGFVVGQIQDNGPLLSPERIGYGGIMVVAEEFRSTGIGDAMWNAMKHWFLSRGIEQVETYTEPGNTVAENFWEKRGFSTFMHRRKCHIGEHE